VCVRNEARKLSFASKVSHFQRLLSANRGTAAVGRKPALDPSKTNSAAAVPATSQARCTKARVILCTVGVPIERIVISSSAFRISRLRSTPACPNAARPQA
jgi:hypothetical protein